MKNKAINRLEIEERLIPVQIAKTIIKDTRGCYKYIYKCSCGKEFLTYKRSIETGRTKSCGCLTGYFISITNKRQNRKPRNKRSEIDRSIYSVFYSYRSSAKVRNRKFTLSLEDIKNIIFKECYYCGQSPSNTPKRTRDSARLTVPVNGIDRYFNKYDYVVENCVSCCSDCNYFKSSMDGDVFLKKIDKISNFKPLFQSTFPLRDRPTLG